MKTRAPVKVLFCSAAAIFSVAAAPAVPKPDYVLAKTVRLGAPDRWDYVVADSATSRVYVAHGDRVTVLDSRTGTIIGQVEGLPGGTHGIAVSHGTGQGFTDDGDKGEAAAFDLKTLKVLRRIPAAADADGMVEDPATGRIFVVEGDPGTITVIDPKTDTVVSTIQAGEKMEYLAADHAGRVYIAGEARGDMLKVDARTATIVARWPTPNCASPHGLAIDEVGMRAFMGCANQTMMVVDLRSGRVVAQLPTGRGSDAIAFDPNRKRVFSSNGRDGTVSVYRQVSPDRYEPMAAIATMVSARNMAVEPRSGRLFVVGAETDASPTPGGRPRVRPETARVMIYDPVS
jgi:YVTN family beta-propeller protein